MYNASPLLSHNNSREFTESNLPLPKPLPQVGGANVLKMRLFPLLFWEKGVRGMRS